MVAYVENLISGFIIKYVLRFYSNQLANYLLHVPMNIMFPGFKSFALVHEWKLLRKVQVGQGGTNEKLDMS